MRAIKEEKEKERGERNRKEISSEMANGSSPSVSLGLLGLKRLVFWLYYITLVGFQTGALL